MRSLILRAGLLLACVVAVLTRQSAGASTDPTCSSVMACLEWVNSGSGQAIEGLAQGNGSTTSIGVEGLLTNKGYAGVLGKATSTDLTHPAYGVIGVSSNGIGIIANNNVALMPALLSKNYSTAATGVAMQGISVGNTLVATSSKANGVVGQTKFLSSSATNAQAGMLGQDISPNPAATNVPPKVNFTAGVAGTSATGYGVVGTAGEQLPGGGGGFDELNWIGVQGSSPGGIGELGTTKSMGFNLGSNSDGGVGDGVFGSGNIGVEVIGNEAQLQGSECCWTVGIGVKATGELGAMIEGNADPSGHFPNTPALYVTEDNPGQPIIIANSQSNGDVMSLDSNGNMILRGTLTQSATPLTVRKTTVGSSVLTYSAQQTLPTIEDFGSAQLVNGQAYVRIDPAFSATMDRARSYMVFITPNGDSHGVYVSQKTLSGFQVHENQNGHSTLAFDYRIVAQPYDDHRVRLPLVRAMLTRNLQLLKHIAPPMRGPFRIHYGAGYIPR